MKMLAALTLFAWSVVLAVVVLLLVSKPITALSQYQDQLENTFAPSHAQQQPYGGCDEAYLYPDTPGYRWCQRNGYLK